MKAYLQKEKERRCHFSAFERKWFPLWEPFILQIHCLNVFLFFLSAKESRKFLAPKKIFFYIYWIKSGRPCQTEERKSDFWSLTVSCLCITVQTHAHVHSVHTHTHTHNALKPWFRKGNIWDQRKIKFFLLLEHPVFCSYFMVAVEKMNKHEKSELRDKKWRRMTNKMTTSVCKLKLCPSFGCFWKVQFDGTWDFRHL